MEADDQIDYYIRSDDYVQVFTYRVAHTDIVAPEDTYILEQPKEHEYQLTAYACYPAGSNKQRKYVRAILEDSSLQDILTPTQELHAAAPVST
jgi:LPXTG-site transpeptidase (sortase) family protein